MLGLNGKLLDFIYPVGSYYETSDTSFDPNTAWGGTWLEDTKGRVTVALDSEDAGFDTINEIGGEKEHTLTIDEMPSHDHAPLKGRFSIEGDAASAYGSGSSSLYRLTYDTKTAETGGSQAHNNLQPYIVVKRWHRTA